MFSTVSVGKCMRCPHTLRIPSTPTGLSSKRRMKYIYIYILPKYNCWREMETIPCITFIICSPDKLVFATSNILSSLKYFNAFASSSALCPMSIPPT